MKKEKGIHNSKNVMQNSTISDQSNVHIGDVINVESIVARKNKNKNKNKKKGKKVVPNIKNIKQLISKHKIKAALEMLLLYVNEKEEDLYNQVLHQSQRWNKLKKDRSLGLLSIDEENKINNRIIYSLLGLVEELEE